MCAKNYCAKSFFREDLTANIFRGSGARLSDVPHFHPICAISTMCNGFKLPQMKIAENELNNPTLVMVVSLVSSD